MVAITHATPALLFATRPMRIFDALMRPFVFVLDRATEAILALFHLKPIGQHKIVYTADELKQLVSESQHRGEIEPVEREIIHHAFEFAGRTLEEVMIPRTAMIALEQDATVTDFLNLYDETGHTRFPVYAGSVDNIVGFVWAKDILRALARDPAARQSGIQSFMRNAVFVPGSKDVGAMFTEMRHNQTQVAIVIDEYGGTAGMVTVEVIIEEVVGRIGDELVATPSPVRKLDETNVEADASLRIDEVNEQLALRLPESENYETVAGLVLEEMRRIPQPGDSITIGNTIITVRQMKDQKIERVLISKLPA
jgi:CBS domain containing-hemolysin-like protein